MKLLIDEYESEREKRRVFRWYFDLTERKYETYIEKLNSAIDLMHSDYKKAYAQLIELSVKYKGNAFDAIHHAALLCVRDSDKIELLEPILTEITDIKIDAGFDSKKDRIKYTYNENRPYFRLIHQLSLSYLKNQSTHELGVSYLQELLDVEPNDNLGCRYILAWEYIRLGKFKNTIKISSHYNSKGYYDDELTYAQALALFSSKNMEDGFKKLKLAMQQFPLYGMLIVQDPTRLKKYLDAFDENSFIGRGSLDEAISIYNRTFELWEPLLNGKSDSELRSQIFHFINDFFKSKNKG